METQAQPHSNVDDYLCAQIIMRALAWVAACNRTPAAKVIAEASLLDAASALASHRS